MRHPLPLTSRQISLITEILEDRLASLDEVPGYFDDQDQRDIEETLSAIRHRHPLPIWAINDLQLMALLEEGRIERLPHPTRREAGDLRSWRNLLEKIADAGVLDDY